MSINRCKRLCQYIHYNGNSERNSKEIKETSSNKLKQFREMVTENCKKIEPEVNQSISEQIILAKTSIVV